MGFQKHDGIVQQSSAAKYFRPMKKNYHPLSLLSWNAGSDRQLLHCWLSTVCFC